MKKQTKKQKIHVTTETIRALAPTQLVDVVGGGWTDRCNHSWYGTCEKTL
jgi:hypothetical protein